MLHERCPRCWSKVGLEVTLSCSLVTDGNGVRMCVWLCVYVYVCARSWACAIMRSGSLRVRSSAVPTPTAVSHLPEIWIIPIIRTCNICPGTFQTILSVCSHPRRSSSRLPPDELHFLILKLCARGHLRGLMKSYHERDQPLSSHLMDFLSWVSEAKLAVKRQVQQLCSLGLLSQCHFQINVALESS